MTELIEAGSRTAKAGMKIAKMQGLEGEDIILFANALTAEYMSDEWTPSDAALMVGAMEDFELKPSEPVIKEIRIKNGYYFNVLDFDSDYGTCTNTNESLTLEQAIENNEEWMHVIDDASTLIYITKQTEKMKALLHVEKDDFIVGKVVTNQVDGDAATRIISYEKLPKQFSGAEVEIRLKKIEKPPFKKVYEGIGRLVRQNDDSPPFVAVDSGKLSSRGRTDYIIFSEAERELLGKNIRVTIEEVQ
jgi:hypothetical protein